MAGTQGKQGESGISRGAEDPDASNTPSTEEGLEFVAETPTEANHANSVKASMPPDHGSAIVRTILEDAQRPR